MLRTGLAGAFALLASAAVAQPLTVGVGSAIAFPAGGQPPRPGPARRVPIGPADPAPGEIVVGLAPAGNAVGVARLHVYERTRVPVDFEATALRDGKAGATARVCGRREMDVWVTFAAGTEAARLSGFAAAKPGCRR